MYINVKRILDIVISSILLIIFAIPMIIIAIAIKLEDGGPVIYKSKRMGKELHSKLTHDEMVTKVGKFIRKTSLDELPQLLNILKGEMSFIGPRPWIPDYYEWFTKEQKRRVEVLPGISGLAQVRGRNGITIFEKINYDLQYVDNISFKQDIKLVIETIKTVFSKANAEITEDGIKEEIRELRVQKDNIEQQIYKEVG